MIQYLRNFVSNESGATAIECLTSAPLGQIEVIA